MTWTNLHPATVHFPIGLLVLASVSGLLYKHWSPAPQLVTLTWWPMTIGWTACIVAVGTGLIAQGQLPPDAPYWSILNTHITTGFAILFTYGSLLYMRWWGRGHTTDADPVLDDSSRHAIWVSIALFLGGLLVITTGWTGGQLVFQWGVNVGNESAIPFFIS